MPEVEIILLRDEWRLSGDPFLFRVDGQRLGIQDGELLWQFIQAVRATARTGHDGWQRNAKVLRSLRHVVVRAMLARQDLRDRFRVTWKRACDRLTALEKKYGVHVPYGVTELAIGW
jgi:hypothetical protein